MRTERLWTLTSVFCFSGKKQNPGMEKTLIYIVTRKKKTNPPKLSFPPAPQPSIIKIKE